MTSLPTAMSAPPPRQRATWAPPCQPEEPLTQSLLKGPDVHYAIGDVLGVGRLGEVRAAVHRASGRAVVLRLFSPVLTTDLGSRTALWSALRALLRCESPGLAPVLELGEHTADKGQPPAPWAAMERLVPLAPRVRWNDALVDVVAALHGLQFLHAQGLTHGDPRAHHLMRDAQGTARLTDAGLGLVQLPEDQPTVLGLLRGGVLAHQQRVAADLRGLGDVFRGWTGTDTPPWVEGWLDRIRSGEITDAHSALTLLAASTTLPPPPTGLHGDGGWPQGLRPLHADTCRPPFVGRDAERDALWSAVERVQLESAARVVIVEGGPGVGRARLCEWVATTAAERVGAAWLWAWHGPNGGAGQGIAGMLRRHLGCSGVPPVLARRVLGPALAEGRLTAGGPLAQQRLLDWLVPETDVPVGPLDRLDGTLDVVRAMVRTGPLVVVLEEGWWATESLSFVSHLLDQAPELPVLVLITVRSDRLERRPRAAAKLDALSGHPVTGRVRVPPMGIDELKLLLETEMGVAPELVEVLHQASGGRALEALELIRELDAEGTLDVGPSGRVLGEARVHLPPTVDALWQGRLTRELGARAAEVGALAAAAALGGSTEDPDWDAIAAELGAHQPTVLRHHARAAGLLGGGGLSDPMGLRFAHGSVIPALVRLARRQGLLHNIHARCAEALAAREGLRRPSPARLRHVLGARDPSAARRLSAKALDGLLSAGDVHGAAEVLRITSGGWLDRRKSERATVAGDPARAAAQFALYGAWLASLEGQDARERPRTLRVLAKARRAGWDAVSAQCHLLLGRLSMREGESTEAQEHLEAAERLAARAKRPVLMTRAQLLMAEHCIDEGRIADAEELLDAVDQPDGSALGASVDLLRLHCAFAQGQDPGPMLGAAIDRRHAAGAWHDLVRLMQLQGDVHRMAGRGEAAELRYRQAQRWISSLGLGVVRPPELGLGLLALARDQPREAARLLDGCTTTLGRQGPPGLAAVAHLALARLAMDRGGPDALLHMRQAATLLRVSGAREPDVVPLCEAIHQASSPESGSTLRALADRIRGGQAKPAAV